MSSQEQVEPRLPRRERKKLEMEENILRAALCLFQTKGFEETTLEEISERADVSRATFFNYFRTKEALALRISERVAAEVSGFLERQQRWLGGTRELLREFFVLLAERVQAYPEAFEKVALRLVRFPMPSGCGWGEMLIRFLREGQERGEVRKDLDPQELAEVVITVGLQSILTWLRQQPPRPSLAGLLQRRMGLLWEGMQGSYLTPTPTLPHPGEGTDLPSEGGE